MLSKRIQDISVQLKLLKFTDEALESKRSRLHEMLATYKVTSSTLIQELQKLETLNILKKEVDQTITRVITAKGPQYKYKREYFQTNVQLTLAAIDSVNENIKGVVSKYTQTFHTIEEDLIQLLNDIQQQGPSKEEGEYFGQKQKNIAQIEKMNQDLINTKTRVKGNLVESLIKEFDDEIDKLNSSIKEMEHEKSKLHSQQHQLENQIMKLDEHCFEQLQNIDVQHEQYHNSMHKYESKSRLNELKQLQNEQQDGSKPYYFVFLMNISKRFQNKWKLLSWSQKTDIQKAILLEFQAFFDNIQQKSQCKMSVFVFNEECKELCANVSADATIFKYLDIEKEIATQNKHTNCDFGRAISQVIIRLKEIGSSYLPILFLLIHGQPARTEQAQKQLREYRQTVHDFHCVGLSFGKTNYIKDLVMTGNKGDPQFGFLYQEGTNDIMKYSFNRINRFYEEPRSISTMQQRLQKKEIESEELKIETNSSIRQQQMKLLQSFRNDVQLNLQNDAFYRGQQEELKQTKMNIQEICLRISQADKEFQHKKQQYQQAQAQFNQISSAEQLKQPPIPKMQESLDTLGKQQLQNCVQSALQTAQVSQHLEISVQNIEKLLQSIYDQLNLLLSFPENINKQDLNGNLENVKQQLKLAMENIKGTIKSFI